MGKGRLPKQRTYVRALFRTQRPEDQAAILERQGKAYEHFATLVLGAFREGRIGRMSNTAKLSHNDYVRRLIYDGAKKGWLRGEE